VVQVLYVDSSVLTVVLRVLVLIFDVSLLSSSPVVVGGFVLVMLSFVFWNLSFSNARAKRRRVTTGVVLRRSVGIRTKFHSGWSSHRELQRLRKRTRAPFVESCYDLTRLMILVSDMYSKIGI
jgi:hypothetical protein